MTKEELKQILENPFDNGEWTRVLADVFGVRNLLQTPKQITLPANELAEKAFELGSFNTADPRVVGLYQIDLKDNVRIGQNRVGLRSLLRNIYKYDVDAALVVFVQGEKWRLSLISEIRARDPQTDEVVEQKTEPKRFTYLLGVGETVRTPVDRLGLYSESERKLKDLIDSFAVEPLNKAFFKEYRENVFEKIVNEVKDQFQDAENARLFTQRLLNRLMFLYFIQKKGWMKYGGSEDYLRHIFDDSIRKNENFYRDRLYYVFFYGLSNQAESKEIHDTAELEVLRGHVPYLNGGLFEQEPDGTDEKGKISISNDRFSDILTLFGNYNFTIDESTPFEVQVAVDPEMLGKVFEELVTGRHSSGSYYTPRTVVSFMCREALKHALAECDTPEAIAKLVDESDGKDVKNPEKILERLRSIRACDPACGSGAYLLGMLQELLHVREALFAAEKIAPDAQYNWKREIIENSIYGVDLDRFATQIASLRLWLSLAIESDEPKPLPNLKYKIGCGDSLLAPIEAIGQADLHRRALIEQFRARKAEYTDADDHIQKAEAASEIERLRVEIARTLQHLPEPPSDARLMLARKSITKIEAKLKAALDRGDKHRAEEHQRNLNKLKAEIAGMEAALTVETYDTGNIFDWSVEFAEVFEDGGFDVVLANPPYVKEDVNRSAFDGLRDRECYQGKMDLWYLFGCRALDMLKSGGSMCFIAINNWGTNDGASHFRKKVLSQSRIVEVLDFGDHKIFSAGVQTMVFMLLKEVPTSAYSVRYGRLMRDKVTDSVLEDFLRRRDDLSGQDYVRYTSIISPEELMDEYIRFLPETISRITKKMQTNSNFRLDSSEIHSGIDVMQDFVSRKHLERLTGTATVGEGIFVLSDTEKSAQTWNPAELDLLKPYYTTREIARYSANKSNRFWIIYTRNSVNHQISQFPNIKAHLDRFQEVITSVNKPYGLHRTRDENIFLGAKILATRKCASPTFTLVDFPCYVARTFLIIKPSSKVNLNYLVALLNSRLVAFWLWNKAKIQGNQYQIDVTPLTKIPLINATEKEQLEIARLAAQIAAARSADPFANVSDLEDRIDQQVYELFGLDDDEIAIVQKDWKAADQSS